MKRKEALRQITEYIEHPDGTTTIEFKWTKRLARFVRTALRAQRVSKERVAEHLRDLMRDAS